MTGQPIERRLWWAGLLIAFGLGIEVVASAWGHPLAFVAFAALAIPLVLVGMVVFLWALVAAR